MLHNKSRDKVSSQKRWSKQQFIGKLNPCGYELRIWWFFLWHKQITLYHIVNSILINNFTKCWAIRRLDYAFWTRHAGLRTIDREDVKLLRSALKKARKLN